MNLDVVSLFPYVGGKSGIAMHLIEIIYEAYAKYPEIHTFIEPCGGGGRVIINLPRRGKQIYSEWNPCLSNLFWAVSDKKRVYELIDILLDKDRYPVNEATYEKLHSQYEEWVEGCKPIECPMQSAAHAYYLTHLAHNGRIGIPGFYHVSDDGMYARNAEENLYTEDEYWDTLERLPDFPEILHGIDFYIGDCRRFLQEYNKPEHLIYLDSPYLKDKYISNTILDRTGLVLKEDYEKIKALVDSGRKPVYVKSSKDTSEVKEYIENGLTPVSFCSEKSFERIGMLIKNDTMSMEFNPHNIDETPAIFDYHSVIERFNETIVPKKAGAEMSKPTKCYDFNLRKDYTGGVNVRLHMDIVTLAKQSEAKIMISGYDNSIYEYLLEPPTSWRKIKVGEQAVVSSTKVIKDIETEYIWLNF